MSNESSFNSDLLRYVKFHNENMTSITNAYNAIHRLHQVLIIYTSMLGLYDEVPTFKFIDAQDCPFHRFDYDKLCELQDSETLQRVRKEYSLSSSYYEELWQYHQELANCVIEIETSHNVEHLSNWGKVLCFIKENSSYLLRAGRSKFTDIPDIEY